MRKEQNIEESIKARGNKIGQNGQVKRDMRRMHGKGKKNGKNVKRLKEAETKMHKWKQTGRRIKEK